ncbi:MAG: AAA family ATPase [Candidatus Nanoarchaeia archaeon]|nr:AAA family ATPase [Candidatus Haiyanarchaeum thermophilum]MCW1303069.1 AAA family ATPase [Candidatus Haiyanarchaeum thermophilum]MCW1303734.1 AAA family ATPase [Candidatus Haiyanarchaeum thermophilum]MCW1306821.1 AAA family ATPase [Candidatus Haiyanarchaeum thermophilum]MCW1307063.1 AAA family ATPase [Candidatus Haiyanarchaeum thermophilum]
MEKYRDNFPLPKSYSIGEKVRKIVGIAGTIGSGKDVVSHYLAQKYGYIEIIMGDLVRDLANELKLEPSRENLLKLQKRYVEQFGREYWGKRAVEKIQSIASEKIVVNGIRRIEDIKVLKQAFINDRVVLLVIDADPKIRFERLVKRGREGDPKNFDQFLLQELAERETFDLEELEKIADYKIENDGSLVELYTRVDEFVNKFGLF